MNWKEFFKPTGFKIIFTIIITIIVLFLWITNLSVPCPEIIGYDCSKKFQEAINSVILINIFLIFLWYIIACKISIMLRKK